MQIVFPCPDYIIAKSEQQPYFFVDETEEIYNKITKPLFIDKIDTSTH